MLINIKTIFIASINLASYKLYCLINTMALFKWQYIHLYSGVVSVTAWQRLN
jgi:hypothetical protein